MANRFTRADLVEVPLPGAGADGVCMPTVIMQPSADATNYMLKSTYATNGQIGVVDKAVVAEQANTVLWTNITNLPTAFPPAKHGPQHLSNGNDPIPVATTALDGLFPAGDNNPNDYVGGDIQWHPLPGLVYFRSELPANIDPSFTAGATIATGIIPNPAQGVYALDECFLYGANQTYPPAGMVHFGIYDPGIPGWVQVTQSTEISVLNSSTALVRPILLSAAMQRVWTAPSNSLQWRLVLDQPAGVPSYFYCGVAFFLTQLQTPQTAGPNPGPIK